MLVVEGLKCRFGTKAAVDNVSFSVAPGGFVGVIGRSGAGKSTLLRTINRLALASEGRVLYKGVDITALRGRELRQWRARSAMIFQQFNLVGRLDVLTNVLMGRLSEIPLWRSLAQLWPEEDVAVAMSALEAWRSSLPSAPITSRAVSSSASRSPARSCRNPTSSWPTSQSPPSIRATPRS